MTAVATRRELDGQLVDRILGGDRGAFVEMVRRYDDRLRGLAYKLLAGDRHRMDDVMQDAYLHAFRSMGTFRRDAELGSWLYRIVFNACMDELRRSGRRAQPMDLGAVGWEPPAPQPGPERVVGARADVLEALAALPEDQRATVVLVDGEGFDMATAARILGVAPGTVGSRLSRARATMRRTLGKEDQ